MSKPIIKIHNQETNEVIEREMTDEEYAIHQEFIANQPALITVEQLEEQAQAKQALLNRLGITEEEAKLLLS